MVHLFTLLSDVDSSFVDYYDTFPIKQLSNFYFSQCLILETKPKTLNLRELQQLEVYQSYIVYPGNECSGACGYLELSIFFKRLHISFLF
jgi:hypothetical protein